MSAANRRASQTRRSEEAVKQGKSRKNPPSKATIDLFLYDHVTPKNETEDKVVQNPRSDIVSVDHKTKPQQNQQQKKTNKIGLIVKLYRQFKAKRAAYRATTRRRKIEKRQQRRVYLPDDYEMPATDYRNPPRVHHRT
jgi:glycerol-3-phosphate cytidylyltransferase-like family protein